MTNTLLVYLDGSPASEMVLPYVVKLASAEDKKITLLSTSTGFENERTQADVYLKQIADRLMCQVSVAHSHTTIRAVVWGEDAPNSLLAASKVYGATEIVLSARFATSPRFSLLKKSAVPVVSVHAPGDSGLSRAYTLTRPVLVSVDGSDVAEAALPYALDIARSANVPLILLEVLPSLPEMISTSAFIAGQAGLMYSYNMLQDQQSVVDQSAQRYLSRLRSQCIQAGWGKVLVRLAHGATLPAIVHIAQLAEAGLIVMTSRPRTALPRWLAPSVPEAIARCTGQTVLAISSPSGTGNERGLPSSAAPVRGRDEATRLVG